MTGIQIADLFQAAGAVDPLSLRGLIDEARFRSSCLSNPPMVNVREAPAPSTAS